MPFQLFQYILFYRSFNSEYTIYLSFVLSDSMFSFRFPNVTNMSVRATGIQWLGQLHALAELRGLSGLSVLPEGNPIFSKTWREYAIYRLAHWGLKEINEEPVIS
jgi:hypothetical protein